MLSSFDSSQEQKNADFTRPTAPTSSSSGFYAVVLLRKGEDAEQVEVLLPSDEYAFYPFSSEQDRPIITAAHLGKAARARAERKLQREVDEVVLVYADHPTTRQDLQYGDECDLKPSSQLNALAGEDELARYNDVALRKFYVLVTLPRQTVPMQIEAPAAAQPDRDNKRTRTVAEFTHEEFRATVKQMFKELLTEAEHPIGSVMVPSNDLLTIARSRGRDAAIDLKDVGIKHKPASQTVKLTLNESDYYLGFCRLKSEKLLVQPLLTQLLENVVRPYKYTAFDVHNKRTHLFDSGMPDNLLVRNEFKQRSADDAIPGLVDASSAFPDFVQQQEEKEQADPNAAAEEVEDLPPDYLQKHGITHDTVGLVVEAKPIDKVDDPESHLQLLKYLRDFLLGNPLRQRITGMLTDLRVAYFYVLGRDMTGPRPPNDNDPSVPQMHHVQFLGEFTGAGILQMLRSMLSGEGDILDDTPFFVKREGNDELSHVKFVQRLGRGGFGRVLRVNIGDEDVALKMPYRTEPVQHYNIERELEVTRMIAGKCQNVPLSVEKVQAVGKGYDSLLMMTPVGVPHSRHNWTKELFLGLLDGYRDLHQRLLGDSCHAVVHRDIRPSNIILANGDGYGMRLVLIDWGCAVEEGAHGLYAGSRAYAAYRLYELKSTDPEVATAYNASCVDDYGSFLLTAAATFFMRDGMAECNHRFRSKDTDIYTMRAADWLQFWQDRLPAEWWEMYKSLSMVMTDVGQAHEAVRGFLDRHLPLHTLGF